jgi:hypothetical protein
MKPSTGDRQLSCIVSGSRLFSAERREHDLGDYIRGVDW